MSAASRPIKEPLGPPPPWPTALRQAVNRWRRDKERGTPAEFRYYGRKDRGMPPIVVIFSPRFSGPNRWVLSLGFDTKHWHRGLLLQRYGQGYGLTPHTDLDGVNRLAILILRQPAQGGEMIVDGPHRRLLGGRLWLLDGAKTFHGFSKIEKGWRLSLIYQKGQTEDGLCP